MEPQTESPCWTPALGSVSTSSLPRASLGGPWCHNQGAKMPVEVFGGCARVFCSVMGSGGGRGGCSCSAPSSTKAALSSAPSSSPAHPQDCWHGAESPHGIWVNQSKQGLLPILPPSPQCLHHPRLGDTQCLLSPNPRWCGAAPLWRELALQFC